MSASAWLRIVEEEAGNVARVDRLDDQPDAGLLELAGGVGQVFDEHIFQLSPIDALRGNAGEAVDLAATERPGIGDRGVDAAAELVDAVGQHRDAALALAPVAGRQVEQDLRQSVLAEAGSDHLRRMIVGSEILNALEACAGGGVEAVEEFVLAKEHRQIG